MLLKQSWPQAGKFDSPGIVVLVLVIADEDVMLEEDLLIGIEADDDDEVGVGVEVVVEVVVVVNNDDDEVGIADALVVIPSNAFAKT